VLQTEVGVFDVLKCNITIEKRLVAVVMPLQLLLYEIREFLFSDNNIEVVQPQRSRKRMM
jgi:hypothetical protein